MNKALNASLLTALAALLTGSLGEGCPESATDAAAADPQAAWDALPAECQRGIETAMIAWAPFVGTGQEIPADVMDASLEAIENGCGGFGLFEKSSDGKPFIPLSELLSSILPQNQLMEKEGVCGIGLALDCDGGDYPCMGLLPNRDYP